MTALFQYWHWEDSWATLAFVSIIVGVSIGLFSLTRDHAVRAYYVKDGVGSICIYADVDWAGDSMAFCTDDIGKVLESLNKLNGGLRK